MKLLRQMVVHGYPDAAPIKKDAALGPFATGPTSRSWKRKKASMQIVSSIHGVPIRLTWERWAHIVEARDELAGRMQDVLAAIETPDWVTRGYRGSLLAWKGFGRRGFLVVIYKETSAADGFVITAYFTRKSSKKKKVWPK